MLIKMKRFASIDFLRGLAILMMLILHIISDTLDLDNLLADMGNLSLFELILLIVLPFLGGLAGLFLMISAVGNMISMQKQLKRGRTAKEIGMRQVFGGFLLLIFAMLTEGIIGYHGLVGEVFKHLNDLSLADLSTPLWRGYHFETIHAIAWCVIVNGFVHALLIKNEKYRDSKKLMKIYGLMAIIVVILTPLMWYLADLIVPGFPYGIDPKTGMELQYAVIGKSSIWDFIIRFLISPLAGKWEPIFPYLAVSFIGSIIGIYLTQEKQDINKKVPKLLIKIGLLMFIVGVLGIIANLAMIMTSSGIDPALNIYINISEHRYWTPEHGVPFMGWLFQFLALNGFSLASVSMIIRLVEFRGKGKLLAQKTIFIRRLGFIAFTIYAMQYIYNAMFFIVSSIFANPYQRLPWGPTILVLILSLLAFYLLTWAWEKINYIGSIEWIIGTIASYIIPGKRKPAKRAEGDKAAPIKWWQRGQLDVKSAFYDVEWIDIVNKDEIDHQSLPESILSYKISRLGFIFPPFFFVGYNIARKAKQVEEPNKYQKRGETIGLIGIILVLVLILVTLLLKLFILGISF
ncbi:MAG: heparan-alpha-glucosaminide N-acetyltransferase domain-containing protein [Promethearchaeota archaeon]